MKALLNWLEDRTGVCSFAHEALYERVPGGARWRYVWGSTLVFTFMTQVITGIFLWMAYSPSTQTAWESVYYIEHEMSLGWLLRGMHHYAATAMVVFAVGIAHTMQGPRLPWVGVRHRVWHSSKGHHHVICVGCMEGGGEEMLESPQENDLRAFLTRADCH